MKHASTDVFLNHYLSRRITTDAQAVVRGLAPQEEIMQAACRMSRWINPERPRFLTQEQSRSVDQHPRIRKLLRQQAKLKSKLLPDYKELQRQIRNEKQQLRYALRNNIRQMYDKTQAESDIQRQLSGETFEEKVKIDLRWSTG
jgi:transposase